MRRIVIALSITVLGGWLSGCGPQGDLPVAPSGKPVATPPDGTTDENERSDPNPARSSKGVPATGEMVKSETAL
jgi:hypothetical protein